MSEFKIQKGIKMPSPQPGRKPKYPFGEMKVGDSFLFSKEYSKESQKYALSFVWSWCKRSPGKSEWEFATRAVRLENGSFGLRIWRIK